MFGIGLPEMIVILAVALIVVGPDKLPDMARSVAKWVFELKKTVNQVKESLADEDNLIGSVQSDLRKTSDELKKDLLESKGELLDSDHFSFYEPGSPRNVDVSEGVNGEILEVEPGTSESKVSGNEPLTEDDNSREGDSESRSIVDDTTVEDDAVSEPQDRVEDSTPKSSE